MKINHSRNILISIVLLTSIIVTTIVYSAFSTQLQISGDAIVRSDNDIRITNVKVLNQTNNAYETYNNKYTKETTSMFVTLPSNSSITYEIKITNKNDISYIVQSIEEISNTNANVIVDIELKENDLIDESSAKTFTIKFTNNTTEEQKETFVLKYTFLENRFVVTFNANGGNIDILSKQVSYKKELPSVTIPSKDGYTFKGFYTSANAFEMLSYQQYLTDTSKRINFGNRLNGWNFTSEDVGTHIHSKIIVEDSNLINPPAMDCNDVDIPFKKIEHIGNKWILYIDFDITQFMIERSESYTKEHRFIDINNLTSSSIITKIFLVKDGRKYYDKNGDGVMNYDLQNNTTLYAIWEEN